jgi:DNA-binding transcriptional ArsR family regulator
MLSSLPMDHPPTAPTSTPVTTLRLDRAALRVLAHPLRSRLLTALRSGGPATATALAHILDTNTGATSYHLRRLAGVGLVTETDDGKGRERWWRATTDAHGWTDRDVVGDPEAVAASDWLKRHYLRSFVDRYERWLDTADTWPVEWRVAAESGDTALHVTPEDVAAFERELLELFDRYRERSPDSPDARRVVVFYSVHPSADADRLGQPRSGDAAEQPTPGPRPGDLDEEPER